MDKDIRKLRKGRESMPIERVLKLPMSVGELGEWLVRGRPLLEKNFLGEETRKSEEITKAIIEKVEQRSKKQSYLNAKNK